MRVSWSGIGSDWLHVKLAGTGFTSTDALRDVGPPGPVQVTVYVVE